MRHIYVGLVLTLTGDAFTCRWRLAEQKGVSHSEEVDLVSGAHLWLTMSKRPAVRD